MINYTDALTALVADIVARVEPLAFIDPGKLLVFARVGRTGAEGAYATCHSLNLPTSDPGYYFWRDRVSGHITRRSEWFVTKTPEVWRGAHQLDYLLSFSIPRYCDQRLEGSRKASYYAGFEPWVAKLDTVVHELYHISPHDAGLRRFERADAAGEWCWHGDTFLEDVARFVRIYLASHPEPEIFDFLRYDFRTLVARHGGVTGTVFRSFPSYPQRYAEPLGLPMDAEPCPVVSIPGTKQPARYGDDDLELRCFSENGARRLRPRPLRSALLPTAA